MQAYFRLRLRVLGRQLAELGWWRMLLLAPLLLATVGNALVFLARHPIRQWALPPLLFLLVLGQHRRRTDLDFLHLSAPDFRGWLALEHLLWSLPAALGLLVFGRVGAALLLIALVPLAAWVPAARTRAATQRGRSIFRSEAFEWNTGLLPYDPYFYPRLTGREYLEFTLQARGRPVVDFEGWNQLLELPLDQYAEEYSAGMKKKLALLALLVQPFRYLVLDEPFNGLDLNTNLLLMEILRRLRAQGTGILLTSHLLGSLTELCDELTVLADHTVRRRYTASEFGQVQDDLLDGFYQEKLAQVRWLLPDVAR